MGARSAGPSGPRRCRPPPLSWPAERRYRAWHNLSRPASSTPAQALAGRGIAHQANCELPSPRPRRTQRSAAAGGTNFQTAWPQITGRRAAGLHSQEHAALVLSPTDAANLTPPSLQETVLSLRGNPVPLRLQAAPARGRCALARTMACARSQRGRAARSHSLGNQELRARHRRHVQEFCLPTGSWRDVTIRRGATIHCPTSTAKTMVKHLKLAPGLATSDGASRTCRSSTMASSISVNALRQCRRSTGHWRSLIFCKIMLTNQDIGFRYSCATSPILRRQDLLATTDALWSRHVRTTTSLVWKRSLPIVTKGFSNTSRPNDPWCKRSCKGCRGPTAIGRSAALSQCLPRQHREDVVEVSHHRARCEPGRRHRKSKLPTRCALVASSPGVTHPDRTISPYRGIVSAKP